jgi:predicted amidohydrolase
MKVAAYRMPVDACYSTTAIEAIRDAVRACELAQVALLCCPEAALGGLADYVDDPRTIALAVHGGGLARALAPLASATVTCVVGFTEVDEAGRLYNSAAVYEGGVVRGIYRKQHPAIRHSRYTAGTETPVFAVDGLRLGVLICRDSTDAALATALVADGAQLLVIPTSNAMPRDRGGPALVAEAHAIDQDYATTLGVPVVRADVVGEARGLWSAGASAITAAGGVRVGGVGSGMIGLLVGDATVRPRRSPFVTDAAPH